MKHLIKKLLLIFLISNITIENKVFSLGRFWGSEKQTEEIKRSKLREHPEGSESEDSNSKEIQKRKRRMPSNDIPPLSILELLNIQIQRIIMEELKLAKEENKETLGQIIGTVQNKLNIIITRTLDQIIKLTDKSKVLEYKITNRLAIILDKLWNDVRKNNLAELLLSKIDLLENITKTDLAKSESILEQNILIKQTSKLVTNTFSEIITEVKIKLKNLDTREAENEIVYIVDMLIEKIYGLSIKIIDEIVSVKLTDLFSYLLRESNIVTRTAAIPILKYKSTTTIKEYLELALKKITENKNLIIEYTTPHIIEICKKN